MKQELKESILEQLSRMNGQVGFYYKNLISSETLTYHENEQFRAAKRGQAAASCRYDAHARAGQDQFR